MKRLLRERPFLSCLVALVVGCVAFYAMYFRYLPPEAPSDINQADHRELIQKRVGIELPADARIIAATDGRPWDGMNGLLIWYVYMPRHIQFPHHRDGIGMSIDKSVMIRIVEGGFWPRKIHSPEGYTYHSWKNGRVDIRVTSVKGKMGTYVAIETYER
ncbi:hypothetical protein [Noviherbaspirillum aridicola]|uniref:Uncharacterized protein n=1 Tax=Noviherbaspirillum aridicola TaxID=2849687 RepID=A0ABQ4Q4H8_9BURK|nr:hypothetical protein [Noviherbaspirillum aridicola]GIZ52098.1 hypothetical protein NCCP691_21120 [Noviherbaspirillum aridicola]